jgi:hypothetical protein
MDQSMEFQGIFKKLCVQALIDHNTTFCDHSEANGFLERMVPNGEERFTII